MNLNRFPKAILLILAGMIFLTTSPGMTSCSSERSANVKRAEREKARKDKAARKKYEQAVKLHLKRQSKETRAMMKEAQKDSPGNTPLKRSSGKKCK